MAINLKAASEGGYMIKQVQAYDNFPMTRHVETVVLMTRAETSGTVS